MRPVTLGFAVKVLADGGLPSHDTRRWQSGPHLSVSLERLEAVLEYCGRAGIGMYRMASGLVPYGSHPDMPQFWTQLDECAGELERIGAKARDLGVRLSFHPGQYCVLNSERPEVMVGAAHELELHARTLDMMGQPDEAVVVVHVGGAAGGVRDASHRFVRGYSLLSERAQARLVIENDDRLFSLDAVMCISLVTGSRVVWDTHHHDCHNPERIPAREAFDLAMSTWPSGVVPKVHFSSPRTGPNPRAHAEYIDAARFERFLRDVVRETRVDVMLEAKAKDLALRQLRDELDIYTSAAGVSDGQSAVCEI